MSRLFAYCRVSTPDQSTDNQVQEIHAAGFNITPKRTITECISGSTHAASRPAFAKLLDRLDEGDVLVVTKLDRLGRNAIDIRTTVDRLQKEGVKVHCLALGGVDLTSSAGRMAMQVIAAVAEFERDLLVERTQQGLIRAKSEGKHCGRPMVLNDKQREEVLQRLAQGISVAAIAREFDASRQTIMRVRDSV